MRGRKKSINSGNRKSDNIYGYDAYFDDAGVRRIRVNEAEAKVVKNIFSLYKRGKSFRQIAMLLNEKGTPTKSTGKMIKNRITGEYAPVKGTWMQSHISVLIRRPEYMGYVWDWDKKNLLPATNVPKILDMPEPEWREMVANVTALAEQRNHKGIKLSQHSLSGLIRCKHCEAPYYFRPSADSPQHHYVHKAFTKKQKNCKKSAHYLKVQVEQVLDLAYHVVFADPDETHEFVSKYIEEIKSRNADNLVEADAFRKQIAKTDAGIKNLVDAIEKTGADAALVARLTERKQEKRKLEAKMEGVLSEVGTVTKEIEKVAQDFAGSGLDKYRAADGAGRRLMLSSILESLRWMEVLSMPPSAAVSDLRLRLPATGPCCTEWTYTSGTFSTLPLYTRVSCARTTNCPSSMIPRMEATSLTGRDLIPSMTLVS